MVTAPIENEPWPSKIGVKESPPSTDFQTPPAAAPTYQVRLLEGSIATSDTRPDVSAGPMERSLSPARDPVFDLALSGFAAGSLLPVFCWAPAAADAMTRSVAARMRM